MAARLPSVRGTDRIVGGIRGKKSIKGPVRGLLTNGTIFKFENLKDPALAALVHLQYVPPALAPVLEAILHPGACFYDIGANIGLYSLWASQLVGLTGEIHAFEPASSTRELMGQLFAANNVRNVAVVPCAVGASAGWVSFQPTAGSSAHSRVVTTATKTTIEVEMICLDDYALRHSGAPCLVKIDVEGHELQVLEGGRGLLERHRPIIVLEAIPSHLERNGTAYAEIYELLEDIGYELYDLTPRGLRPSLVEGPSTNVLALCPDATEHRTVYSRLLCARFKRNQTV